MLGLPLRATSKHEPTLFAATGLDESGAAVRRLKGLKLVLQERSILPVRAVRDAQLLLERDDRQALRFVEQAVHDGRDVSRRCCYHVDAWFEDGEPRGTRRVREPSTTHLPTQSGALTLSHGLQNAKNGIIPATWHDSCHSSGTDFRLFPSPATLQRITPRAPHRHATRPALPPVRSDDPAPARWPRPRRLRGGRRDE